MRVLDTGSAIRILRLFGNTEAQHVTPQVGPEQEYFLIDEKVYRQREDLKLCGRTLFGARPSKGQELDDHYYRCHQATCGRVHAGAGSGAVEAGRAC